MEKPRGRLVLHLSNTRVHTPVPQAAPHPRRDATGAGLRPMNAGRGWLVFCLSGACCPPARPLGLGHMQGAGRDERAQFPHSAGQPKLMAGTDPTFHRTGQARQQSWGRLWSHNRVVQPSACCRIHMYFPRSVSSSGWAAHPFCQALTAPGNRGAAAPTGSPTSTLGKAQGGAAPLQRQREASRAGPTSRVGWGQGQGQGR